ncbi:MAG: ABC transporter substrate-binding protein, partial [Thiothrix sp.]|nr:ABC transporter substrate-binding protein [Thiothrix sp.]
MSVSRKTLLSLVVASGLLAGAVAHAEDLAALEAAAREEGMLTTIALPHDWCGYGGVIEGFKTKYPWITVNELNPDAGSADELE